MVENNYSEIVLLDEPVLSVNALERVWLKIKFSKSTIEVLGQNMKYICMF